MSEHKQLRLPFPLEDHIKRREREEYKSKILDEILGDSHTSNFGMKNYWEDYNIFCRKQDEYQEKYGRE